MINAIKQILALGFGCYWVYIGSTGGDVLKAIMGGVLLCWGVLDFLSEWRRLYGTIRNVLGSAVGAIIIAYGIVLFVQVHNDWTFALFILLGLAVLLTNLIPFVSGVRFRKVLKMSIRDSVSCFLRWRNIGLWHGLCETSSFFCSLWSVCLVLFVVRKTWRQ